MKKGNSMTLLELNHMSLA